MAIRPLPSRYTSEFAEGSSPFHCPFHLHNLRTRAAEKRPANRIDDFPADITFVQLTYTTCNGMIKA